MTMAAAVGACSPDPRRGGADASAVDGRRSDELAETCEDAAARRSYVGCDYWPTVVANNVWSIFDFAVVVTNAGDQPAEITVDGPNGVHSTHEVAPNAVEKIFLPWVPELKGAAFTECGTPDPADGGLRSGRADGGAYHLVSSRPVSVYQFSALEYRPVGGPPGKDWGACPGELACATNNGNPIGCFAFSNDASLLLPSTALTGNYRITGYPTIDALGSVFGSYFTVTGTQDQTVVNVTLSAIGSVIAGGGIAAQGAGATFSFNVNAGDVVQIANLDGALSGSMGDVLSGGDLSGSVVTATKPVQVITGSPCTQVPSSTDACDHVEETNLPAETLGTDYVVTVPTGPRGSPQGHVVRIYGSFNNTHLVYDPPIASAPTTIHAGEVRYVASVVETDFRVTGDQPFAVSSFQLGGSVLQQDPGPTMGMGDPAQSTVVSVQQFRTHYVFLAPGDYESNFIDVVAPIGTTLVLDNMNVNVAADAVGSSDFGVTRVMLPKGGSGSHVLVADKPVGVQVIGYGLFTSYQYPAGLNLDHIAPIL
jgi:hypothetical protein